MVEDSRNKRELASVARSTTLEIFIVVNLPSGGAAELLSAEA